MILVKPGQLFLFIAALGVMACDGNPVGPSDIVSERWQLVSFEEAGSAPIRIEDPTRYTLTFNGDGRAEIKSDCNSCGGPYSLTGPSISIGPVACTKVFCGDASLDPEYAMSLDRARSVSVNDNAMTIQGEGVRLRFER